MIEQWKKENILVLIKEIEKYFHDCSVNYFQHTYAIDKLNKVELEYLNENLNLKETTGANKDNILLSLLDNSDKDNFSYFLLNSLEIELKVNGFDDLKNTVFSKLAKKYFNAKEYFQESLLLNIFKRGYKIKAKDKVFILELYKSINKQNDLEKWSILRFIQKLNNADQIELALKKQRELFVILSFKMGKPIYFNFPNLLGVSNNAIQHYRECGDIILKAMEVYKRTEKVQKLDIKKGTFNRKRKDYLENRPIQDADFESIAKKIFEELK